MTAQQTYRTEPSAARREVGSLLETGPFDRALRAAIRARGLGLERIRYRLRGRGVSISLATLSHWQSGRCQPERPESLRALEHIEDVLGIPPGSLRHLLDPDRHLSTGCGTSSPKDRHLSTDGGR